MTKFLLIRHATNHTVGKVLAGRKPGIHLDEAGKLQAKHLAERLADLPIKGVYSSPLERAMETAMPVAAMLQLQPQVSEEFIEIDFGRWTGCSIEAISGDPQFQLFNSFRSATHIPDGELMSEAQVRSVSGIQRLCTLHPDELIAIVSHADIIKAIIAYFAGIHLDLLQRMEIHPASVSSIVIYPETASILQINNTGSVEI